MLSTPRCTLQIGIIIKKVGTILVSLCYYFYVLQIPMEVIQIKFPCAS